LIPVESALVRRVIPPDELDPCRPTRSNSWRSPSVRLDFDVAADWIRRNANDYWQPGVMYSTINKLTKQARLVFRKFCNAVHSA